MAADNQRPIGSGFGAKTPAADVVQGMDLTSGLKRCARWLASALR
jgi:hypothetical protein